MLNIFLHFIVSSSVSSGANGGMKFKNTQQKKLAEQFTSLLAIRA